MPQYRGMPPVWHGCMKHNRNHCTECKTCDCYPKS